MTNVVERLAEIEDALDEIHVRKVQILVKLLDDLSEIVVAAMDNGFLEHCEDNYIAHIEDRMDQVEKILAIEQKPEVMQ